MKKQIPQIFMEQLYLNELDEGIKDQIPEDQKNASIKNIEASNREILEEYPPEKFSEAILRRMNTDSRPARKKPVIGTSLFKIIPAAAAILILAINLGQPGLLYQPEGMIRQKGLSPKLSIYRENQETPVELFDNDTVGESDIIQLTYNAAGNSFGVIFSIDGRGVLTLHYPDNESETPVLDPTGSHALSFSYELDDAPDFERFFFISSDTQFETHEVLDSAELLIEENKAATSEQLDLDKDFDQITILLNKE